MTRWDAAPQEAQPRVPGVWRLLAPALVAWGVTAIAVTRPGSAGVVLAGAGLLGVAALGSAFVRGRRRPRAGAAGHRWTTPIALACAILVVLGVRLESGERARGSPELRAAAAAGTVEQLDVTLLGYPAVGAGGRAWASAALPTARGPVPVVLWCAEPDTAPVQPDTARGERDTGREESQSSCGESSWGPGATVSVQGSLTRLEPGASHAYGVRVAAVGSGGDHRRGAAWAAELRTRLRTAAASLPGAELVPGLAVGDTTLVPARVDEQMRETSLTHLVAVSGANCALVTSAVGWCVALCGAGRRARVVAQAVALGGFVVVVGPDPSVQRAAVMAVVVLVSGYGGKRAVALPALGLAIIVLLIRDPWQSLHPGFALSVAATGGIILWAPALRRAGTALLRLPGWLALPVAVATAAQLACAPLLLLLQPGLPAVGVLANVLAAPAAPFGTGLGLLALLLLPLAPWLGQITVWAAAWPAQWIVGTAAVTSELPSARWPWPGGWAGAVLLAAAELALGAAWWIGSGRASGRGGVRPWEGADPVGRGVVRWAWGVAGLGAGIVVAPTLVAPAVSGALTPRDWSVVACDVGQGDAFLVRDPARPREVTLIDTGDDEAALRGCLDRFGVDRIATLVISHDHRDHYGALGAVVSRVDRAIVAPENRADGPARPLLRMLEDAGIPTQIVAAGALPGAAAGPGVLWRVVSPAPAPAPPPGDPNAASIVLLVQAGPLRVLFLGDTGAETQARLLRAGEDLRADILKVAHHGSRDQDPRLPQRVGAELGLISVGAENRYGHPTRDALETLAAAGTGVARTDRLGDIAISGTPDRLSVWGSRADRDPREAAAAHTPAALATARSPHWSASMPRSAKPRPG